MNDTRSYIKPIGIGEVMRSGGAGEVVASKHPNFEPGDRVSGGTGWQSFAVLPGKQLEKLDYPPSISLVDAMSVLGGTGLTAYFGLLDIGKPVKGETVVVSGAAGATGMVVCQIAKILGCKVIGIAGGAEKCAFLKREIGVDEALDYRVGLGERELERFFSLRSSPTITSHRHRTSVDNSQKQLPTTSTSTLTMWACCCPQTAVSVSSSRSDPLRSRSAAPSWTPHSLAWPSKDA